METLQQNISSWNSAVELSSAMLSTNYSDPEEPLNVLIAWMDARYVFEMADEVKFFSKQYGYQARLIISYSVKPSQVIDEKEISQVVRNFLFTLENPAIDAYALVGAQLISIIIVYKA